MVKEKNKSAFKEVVSISLWFIGVIVALSVASGLIQNVLTFPGIPQIITELTGWVIVVISLLSLILAVFSR